ncbi:TrmH family RNA methyltransferase [Allomuricauda sp. SCSIO 65647]|uniref:TrmH family RNA methyltransferase n=1 Tax=Allomuricauda sp. SCSIO 65647 TaxID=2908843 RepID=UPI001F30B587|nr:RNA methyltransferase [Muricauda sp. SCSIO 65647]UJH68182.1 RNA methyltransferase [Muricauda sp. SCSIO 65647]
MVTKNQIKLVKSLQQKKYRNKFGQFVAEGKKLVGELLSSGIEVVEIYALSEEILGDTSQKTILVSPSEMGKMSGLKTPSEVLAVFTMAEPETIDFVDWTLVLDAVRDPGNLGTIIRLCDWYGVKHLICSVDTVDVYNPKVLQATMGSVARVNVMYTDIDQFLKSSDLPIFGTFMDGANIYRTKLPDKGILVMGNEANGISDQITALVQKKIGIPQYGTQTAESLNVATATAVLLNEIRREA